MRFPNGSSATIQLQRGILSISLAAAVCGYIPAAAWAFKEFGAEWPHVDAMFPTSVAFELCAADMPPGAISAITSAGAAWSYKRLSFRFKWGCDPAGKFPVKNGLNQIDFGPLPLFIPATSKVYFKGTTIVECDIRFNVGLNWSTSVEYPKATQWDLMSVAAHEFGHCLGLADEMRTSRGAEPIMGGLLSAGEVRRVLTTDDKNGRNRLYGD
jgi:hypothetical protein